jgi:hypothetical protein
VSHLVFTRHQSIRLEKRTFCEDSFLPCQLYILTVCDLFVQPRDLGELRVTHVMPLFFENLTKYAFKQIKPLMIAVIFYFFDAARDKQTCHNNNQ